MGISRNIYSLVWGKSLRVRRRTVIPHTHIYIMLSLSAWIIRVCSEILLQLVVKVFLGECRNRFSSVFICIK